MASYIPGARVAQGNYGPGTVLESNEYHTVIDFDEHGVRRFVTTIVDLKTTKSLGSFRNSANAFSYIHQLAFYRDVANAAGAEVDTVAIVAVEKSEPYRCGLFCPSDKSIERASEENAAAINELMECERSNVWPTRFEEPILLELE